MAEEICENSGPSGKFHVALAAGIYLTALPAVGALFYVLEEQNIEPARSEFYLDLAEAQFTCPALADIYSAALEDGYLAWGEVGALRKAIRDASAKSGDIIRINEAREMSGLSPLPTDPSTPYCSRYARAEAKGLPQGHDLFSYR